MFPKLINIAEACIESNIDYKKFTKECKDVDLIQRIKERETQKFYEILEHQSETSLYLQKP